MSVPLEAQFAAALERFAPFEAAPLLAVGVSGGSDSLALALLADRWARERGGRAVGLTVDHRLRPDSDAEAAQVGAWLGARGIEHRILVREGPLPARNVQETARAARYELLEAWCRANGCLHLLLAHHREDQAETLVLRLGRGSGLDGLAGMAAVVERDACRILRPLLAFPRAALAAWLQAEGQAWIEDPSNRAERFARVRVRSALAAAGASPARLLLAARNLGRARAALEAEVDALLGRSVALDPAGFALADPDPLLGASEEVRLRALARLVTTVGGNEHPPRLERLERLASRLGESRTLGGCRVLPWRGRLLVCREPALVEPPVALEPGRTVRWDGRFLARLAPDAPRGLRLGAAGGGGPGAMPGPAKASLPALFDLEGRVAVPHLRLCREGSESWLAALVWKPRRKLTSAGFTVA
ncbi:MAG: tRNA lysidine(34) synthetase TilS [Rhodospirillales bacterium]|nr:tRNA lysidine(34) synthetase TilS [Rhodospirillales bacterium]